MAAPTSNTTDYLLYPELLTEDGLRMVLKQRYITEKGINDYDKEDLLQLYYKYFIPRPQRKYRSNRHGREMTRKQILLAKKRRNTVTEDEPPKKKKSSTGSQLITPLGDSSPQSNRLKPPPDCIDFKKKVIRLSSNSEQQVAEISSKVNKLSTCSAQDKSETKTVISLKNSISEKNKTSHPKNNLRSQEEQMDVDTKEEHEKQPKKKIKKISWP